MLPPRELQRQGPMGESRSLNSSFAQQSRSLRFNQPSNQIDTNQSRIGMPSFTSLR